MFLHIHPKGVGVSKQTSKHKQEEVMTSTPRGKGGDKRQEIREREVRRGGRRAKPKLSGMGQTELTGPD
jgi:hypothetical protein